MIDQIINTIIQEFSDISDLEELTTIFLRLLVSMILGGLIGFERERKSRSAGIRTHMLVCVGTAMFVIGPMQAGMDLGDMSRVLQGVIQGIGFLGAGAIVLGTAKQRAQGLTTAASVWATAGIGMAAGLGMESTAVLATIFVLVILALLPLLFSHKDTDND